MIQTAVTALLTLWADRADSLLGDSSRLPPSFLKVHMFVIQLRLIWRAVNAPTLPFNYAGHRAFQILGLSVPEILYLLAVAALWFLVGYFHEAGKERKANLPQGPGHRKKIALAILVWGVILLLFALLQIREAFPWGFTSGIFNVIAFLNVPLYALWSVVLIRLGFKSMPPVAQRTRPRS